MNTLGGGVLEAINKGIAMAEKDYSAVIIGNQDRISLWEPIWRWFSCWQSNKNTTNSDGHQVFPRYGYEIEDIDPFPLS